MRIILVLALGLGTAVGQTSEYVITIPGCMKAYHVQASSRLAAIGSVTVWSSGEWKDFQATACKPDSTGKQFCEKSKPEPMDIPAIKVPIKSTLQPHSVCDAGVCFDGAMQCSHHGTYINDGKDTCSNGWEWSCKKGSGRVLLFDVEQRAG
jgi:hypothetical protein